MTGQLPHTLPAEALKDDHNISGQGVLFGLEDLGTVIGAVSEQSGDVTGDKLLIHTQAEDMTIPVADVVRYLYATEQRLDKEAEELGMELPGLADDPTQKLGWGMRVAEIAAVREHLADAAKTLLERLPAAVRDELVLELQSDKRDKE